MDPLDRELIVLTYHHVAVPPRGTPIRGLYVTPANFAWQIAWLRGRGVRFTTLRQFGEAAPAAGPPPVALTFDDGYRDVYRHAYPVLRRHGIPAVVFPVAGGLGKSGVVWPESEDATPAELLTEAEVREMAEGGIEFGSHLMDHVHADRLGQAPLTEQLVQSKALLERVSGQDVVSLAYPFGAHSDGVVSAAAAAGYRIAVTTERGSNRGVPPLRLRRLPVKGTRWYHRWQFRRALSLLLQHSGSGPPARPPIRGAGGADAPDQG